MRWTALFAMLITSMAWGGSAGVADRLCAAALVEGRLAAEIEQLAESGRYPFQRAEDLLTLPCHGQQTLLSVLVHATQAENLEYAVIDMGANVDLPLIQQEGGKLTLVQYLLQQAGLAGSPEVRAFAMDYMRELRDVDFNPNLIWISMN